MKRLTQEQVDKKDQKTFKQVKKYIEQIESGEMSLSDGLDWIAQVFTRWS